MTLPIQDRYTRNNFLRWRRSDDELSQLLPKVGLSLLHKPRPGLLPSVDFIFIHGLGGDRIKTWRDGNDPDKYWLQKWLPEHPEFESARIWTFGYDSKWYTPGPPNDVDITAFAYFLLNCIRLAASMIPGDEPIGKIPLIFIGHSMGGLVIKMAYILGQKKVAYDPICHSTSGIIFMATPHGGSDLAKVLKNGLHPLGLIIPSREYVKELIPGSNTLEYLSHKFRDLSADLDIVSFYETVKMALGPFGKMVVPQDSCLLGYPNEMPIPVDADHRTICKFPDRHHPRYQQFQKILASIMPDVNKEIRPGPQDYNSWEAIELVRRFLGVPSEPLEDQIFYSNHRTESSCQWVLRDANFINWVNDDLPRPRILRIHGPPGSGKSVLASFLIDYLRETLNVKCLYFFFQTNKEAPMSINTMLRYIAYQAACEIPEFRNSIEVLAQDETVFKTSGPEVLWERLFSEIFAQLPFKQPIYWIIDGLDEASAWLLAQLGFVSSSFSTVPVRIAVLSRSQSSAEVETLNSKLPMDMIHLHKTEDIQRYVEEQVQHLPGETEEQKTELVNAVLRQANGSFIWASKILMQMKNVRDPTTNRQLLARFNNMDLLYHHMTADVSSGWRENEKALARNVLAWITFSEHPMTMFELQEILHLNGQGISQLEGLLTRLCGNFIQIDHQFRVLLTHGSARRFLTEVQGHEMFIDSQEAHLLLLNHCISILTALNQENLTETDLIDNTVILYAVTSWHYHLSMLDSTGHDEVLTFLTRLFRGRSIMIWIYLAARYGQVDMLEVASQRLLSSIMSWNLQRNGPIMSAHSEEMKDMSQWALDFVKILGMYGDRLELFPSIIFNLIPPFCPPQTSVYKHGSRISGPSLTVKGLSDKRWSAIETRFQVTDGKPVREVLCGGRFFITTSASMNGHIHIYNTATHRKVDEFEHGEPVLATRLSNSGNKIAIYGYQTLRIWDINEGRFIDTIRNPTESTPLDIAFTLDDEKLYLFSDDGMIRRALIGQRDGRWEDIRSVLTLDCHDGSAMFSIPLCASFTHDCSMLAIAYDKLPLSLWRISQHSDTYDRHLQMPNHRQSTSSIKRITWNPVYKHLTGVYESGSLFKWKPGDNDIEMFDEMATDIKCSRDGQFLVSAHAGGTLKLRRFLDFVHFHTIQGDLAIADFTISRDSQRIYDVRASYCTVWRPLCLSQYGTLRSMEKDSSDSGEYNIPSQFFTAFKMHKTPITVTAVCERTAKYCVGDASGALQVYSADGDKLHSSEPNRLSITNAVWGGNAEYIATTDISTSVHLRKMHMETCESETIFRYRTEMNIIQLLFNRKADLLLAVGSHSLTLFSTHDGTVLAQHDTAKSGYRWINHPYEDAFLLGVDTTSVVFMQWTGLQECGQIGLEISPINIEETTPHVSEPGKSAQIGDQIEDIWISPDGSLLFVKTCFHRRLKGQTDLHFTMRCKDLELKRVNSENEVIRLQALPFSIQQDILHPLGFVNANMVQHSNEEGKSQAEMLAGRLVFLDHFGWLCSMPLGSNIAGSDMIRHFILPTNWMDTEGLKISRITGTGEFLCPKGHELGSVCGGLEIEWKP